MKRALALGLFIAASAAASPSPPPSPPLEVVAPDAYQRLVVAPHKGRPLLVNFWATWCDPCREEMPALLAAAARGKIDLTLVSVDSSSAGLEPVRAFLRSMHAEVPAFIIAPGDPETFINVVDKNWDGTVPFTVVYAADGHVLARLHGAQSAADFKRAIAAAKK